jgi:formamidopyrimidine-DNA glycosylase
VPEGHTIHRLARAVRARLAGQALAVSSPQGPFAPGGARIDGRVLARVDAHGKHLFLGFGDEWVHVHLGLFGRVTLADGPAPAPRGAVRLRLVGADGYLDLRGPTACRLIDDDTKQALHDRLGADPLRRDADPMHAFEKLRRRRLAMGAILLDQSVVAGIGNVYRAELLHRAGLSPHREARRLEEYEWVGLWDDTVRQLRAGARSGRIVTTEREHRERPTGRARGVDAHYVYKRAGLPCRRCGSMVVADEMAVRTIFWCPGCQSR